MLRRPDSQGVSPMMPGCSRKRWAILERSDIDRLPSPCSDVRRPTIGSVRQENIGDDYMRWKQLTLSWIYRSMQHRCYTQTKSTNRGIQ
jgi:hypothetical protein